MTNAKHLVVDSSIFIAVLLNEPNGNRAESAIARGAKDGLIIPALCATEVLNSLLVNNRRGRIDWAGMEQCLDRFEAIPIALDEASTHREHLRDVVLPIAQTHKLTLYDATYVELARRTGGVLATFDAAMMRAAQTLGIELAIQA